MNKKTLFWILAIVITLSAVYYQRKTGPTYDKIVKTEIKGEEYKFKMLRAHGGEEDAHFALDIEDKEVTGKIVFRRFPTNDEWSEQELFRNNGQLVATLPHQPPAGKIEYYIVLNHGNQEYFLAEEEPVKIRFRGDVPGWVLLPHVLAMFAAMLLSNLSGLLAAGKISQYKMYTTLTLVLLFIGGIILGPIVQKYAFGAYWTGWPFGNDLTDNKTLVAFIMYIVAFVGNRKKDRPILTIAAAVILLAVYSIPHSALGSELDYEKGEVVTGMVNNLLLFR